VHGYGYTKPTGIPVIRVPIIGWTFIGPWLQPALLEKNVNDPQEQKDIVFALIDRYNLLLQKLDEKHSHFHAIDLRSVINSEIDWVNELHIKNSCFARAADRIHWKIQNLVGGFN